MELTIRDWMVVIGVILIVAVGLDAWRRVRRERYARVKVRLVEPDGNGGEPASDIAWLKELPNGGGRTVDRRDIIKATNKSAADAAQRQADAAAATAAAKSPARKPARPAKPAAPPNPAKPEKTAPDPDEVELVEGFSGADKDAEPTTLDWLDDMGAEDEPEQGVPAPAADPGTLPRDIDPEVFMLNVVARSREGFRGEDILHILLACDLRFGDMNFFHRHEFEAGRGAIQFSVANMMQPGVFDIDRMSDLATPGLVFFVTLPGPEDMMKAFDYMLETAQAVARNLEGDVLDEARNPLSKQSLEHSRQQVRDLERRMLARTR
jgi:cell division protein ZipA